MSMRPAQNAGTAIPSWASADTAVPDALRWPTAATTPSGIATTTAITIPMITSGMVTWRRTPISLAIDRFDTKVVPRSPVRRSPSQRA